MRTRAIRGVLSVLVCVAVWGAAPAEAQPVYFLDDFEGNALGQHWTIQPAPIYLIHNVSNGMLNITSLPLPSSPPSGNYGAISHSLATGVPGDFAFNARMGWDPGSGRRIVLSLNSNAGWLGTLTYQDTAGGSVRAQTPSGASPPFPAPASGLIGLGVSRAEGQLRFEVEGTPFWSVPEPVGAPLGYMYLEFFSSHPNPAFAPIHVDRIQIIPNPGCGCIALLGVCMIARRRR